MDVSLQGLPIELLTIIFSYLNIQDFIKFQFISKHFNNFFNTDLYLKQAIKNTSTDQLKTQVSSNVLIAKFLQKIIREKELNPLSYQQLISIVFEFDGLTSIIFKSLRFYQASNTNSQKNILYALSNIPSYQSYEMLIYDFLEQYLKRLNTDEAALDSKGFVISQYQLFHILSRWLKQNHFPLSIQGVSGNLLTSYYTNREEIKRALTNWSKSVTRTILRFSHEEKLGLTLLKDKVFVSFLQYRKDSLVILGKSYPSFMAAILKCESLRAPFLKLLEVNSTDLLDVIETYPKIASICLRDNDVFGIIDQSTFNIVELLQHYITKYGWNGLIDCIPKKVGYDDAFCRVLLCQLLTVLNKIQTLLSYDKEKVLALKLINQVFDSLTKQQYFFQDFDGSSEEYAYIFKHLQDLSELQACMTRIIEVLVNTFDLSRDAALKRIRLSNEALANLPSDQEHSQDLTSLCI